MDYSLRLFSTFAAFILIVALRLYQQSVITNLDNQNVDPSQESIQISEIRASEASKLEVGLKLFDYEKVII